MIKTQKESVCLNIVITFILTRDYGFGANKTASVIGSSYSQNMKWSLAEEQDIRHIKVFFFNILVLSELTKINPTFVSTLCLIV